MKINFSKKAKLWISALLLLILGNLAYTFLATPNLEKPKASLNQTYAHLYGQILTLKDGEKVTLVPVQNTAEHFDYLKQSHVEPSCAAMMMDGKPWKDKPIRNNQLYYVYSWEAFHDMKKAGASQIDPVAIGFLAFDSKGDYLGDMGIQLEKGRPDELFYNILPKGRGRHLGYKSAQFLMKFYGEHFTKMRMGANILPHNKASQGLFKKLGFKPTLGKDGRQTMHTNKYGRLYGLWYKDLEASS